MGIQLPVQYGRQPDDTTCGPASLHAICRCHGDPIDLQTVIKETAKLLGKDGDRLMRIRPKGWAQQAKGAR